MTASKKARLGLPTTSALTPAAVSSAATKGPGPRESVLFEEDEDARMYLALCVAMSGFRSSNMRNAVLRCSYANREGARPMTTQSYSPSDVETGRVQRSMRERTVIDRTCIGQTAEHFVSRRWLEKAKGSHKSLLTQMAA